jgi:hypothetical protein
VAHAKADREATNDRDRNSSPKNDAPQLAPPYRHHREGAQCIDDVRLRRVVGCVSAMIG